MTPDEDERKRFASGQPDESRAAASRAETDPKARCWSIDHQMSRRSDEVAEVEHADQVVDVDHSAAASVIEFEQSSRGRRRIFA